MKINESKVKIMKTKLICFIGYNYSERRNNKIREGNIMRFNYEEMCSQEEVCVKEIKVQDSKEKFFVNWEFVVDKVIKTRKGTIRGIDRVPNGYWQVYLGHKNYNLSKNFKEDMEEYINSNWDYLKGKVFFITNYSSLVLVSCEPNNVRIYALEDIDYFYIYSGMDGYFKSQCKCNYGDNVDPKWALEDARNLDLYNFLKSPKYKPIINNTPVDGDDIF